MNVTTTIESTVDPGWIEFVTGGTAGFSDVFLRGGYCGYCNHSRQRVYHH